MGPETGLRRPGKTVRANYALSYQAAKRLMDIVISALLLVVLSPLLVVIALCIRLDSPGPVFFRQTRVGYNRRRRRDPRRQPRPLAPGRPDQRSSRIRRQQDLGARPFTMYKFRSMRCSADPTVHRQYIRSFIQNQAPGAGGGEGAPPLFKLAQDARITRIGRILRRTSLDELPQLINVLKGDMSLIGPRPAIPYEVEDYQEWHKARLGPVPGLTGWWQVHGRSRVSFDEMVRMDIYYSEHRSFGLDVKILLLTPWAVLSCKGAR